MAPESTMSTTESASDTTTVRPRELERERFLLARRPGSPAMRSSSGFLGVVPVVCAFSIARSACLESLTSCCWRMASMAETLPARHAGAQALASSTRKDAAAMPATTAGLITRGMPWAVPESELRSIASNARAELLSMAATPASPAASPTGMPTRPMAAASRSTVLLSWRLDAPSEESRPNWRVRSATEIEKELPIIPMAATTMTPPITATMPRSDSMVALSSLAIPWRESRRPWR